jgi:hypothetical protein
MATPDRDVLLISSRRISESGRATDPVHPQSAAVASVEEVPASGICSGGRSSVICTCSADRSPSGHRGEPSWRRESAVLR